MPVSTTTRRCEICGGEFTLTRRDKRHCSSKCRFTASNYHKDRDRRKILASVEERCSVPGCNWKSRRGRMYVHSAGDVRVVLCGLQHAAKYRPQSKGGEVPPVVGRLHHGYFHTPRQALRAVLDTI